MERGYGGLTTVSGWEPPIVNPGSGLQPVASALVPGGIMALPSFTELGQCKTYILFFRTVEDHMRCQKRMSTVPFEILCKRTPQSDTLEMHN